MPVREGPPVRAEAGRARGCGAGTDRPSVKGFSAFCVCLLTSTRHNHVPVTLCPGAEGRACCAVLRPESRWPWQVWPCPARQPLHAAQLGGLGVCCAASDKIKLSVSRLSSKVALKSVMKHSQYLFVGGEVVCAGCEQKHSKI